jgi:hypothetical protein
MLIRQVSLAPQARLLLLLLQQQQTFLSAPP